MGINTELEDTEKFPHLIKRFIEAGRSDELCENVGVNHKTLDSWALGERLPHPFIQNFISDMV